jgi:hypothetical protein
MAINEDMDSETAFSLPFRLWRVDARNEFIAVVAEADTLEEISSVPRRPDWRYQITCRGFPLYENTALLPGDSERIDPVDKTGAAQDRDARRRCQRIAQDVLTIR